MTRFLKLSAGNSSAVFSLVETSVSPILKVASKNKPKGKLYSAPKPNPKSNVLLGFNDKVSEFPFSLFALSSAFVKKPKFTPTLGRNPAISYFTQRGMLSCCVLIEAPSGLYS